MLLGCDLGLAQIDKPEAVPNELLCFHCQQAAEKAIKAMIVQGETQVPRTHNIEALIEQLPESVAAPEGLREATDLTQYAVVARYPAGVATVSDEEHRRAVAQAEAVVAWAERHVEGLKR